MKTLFLTEIERKKFYKNLENVLYSRYWCKKNGIEYSNPNLMRAKEILYNEMFRDKNKK